MARPCLLSQTRRLQEKLADSAGLNPNSLNPNSLNPKSPDSVDSSSPLWDASAADLSISRLFLSVPPGHAI